MSHQIGVIPGDGIGPEVVGATVDVLRATGVDLETTTFDLGADRYLRDGHVLDDADLESIRGCDAILKGTQVDGVYSADPKRDPDARRFDRLTFMEVLTRDLKVMDASAIALARESNIPIIVFSLHAPGALARVLRGEGPHTTITEEAAS